METTFEAVATQYNKRARKYGPVTAKAFRDLGSGKGVRHRARAAPQTVVTGHATHLRNRPRRIRLGEPPMSLTLASITCARLEANVAGRRPGTFGMLRVYLWSYNYVTAMYGMSIPPPPVKRRQ